jgi:hypothetical protein
MQLSLFCANSEESVDENIREVEPRLEYVAFAI